MKKILVMLFAVACNPPPIRHGKCVVTVYDGQKADQQICVYEGYTWECRERVCVNKGEAKGER